jgi:ribosome-binding factor A
MPTKMRLERISDRIREELAEMAIRELNDPRLEGLSITDVTVDRELSFADIYVSAIEGHERAKDILAGLEHASGFIRHALAERIELRVFPKLRFHWDPTPEKADKIERILQTIHQEENQRKSST